MKYYQFLVAFLLVINSVFAQADIENALLWKVTKGDQEAYLYGTIHISCNAELNPKVEEALTQSDELILEIDLSDPSLQMRMMQQMMLPDQKDASDYLSDEDYQVLKKYVDENVNTVPAFEMVKNMKPILLSSMITQSLLTCTNQAGYDQLLLQKAQQKNIPISGLETVDEQMSALDKIPAKDVYEEIVESIKKDQQEDVEMLHQMMKHYNNADLQSLKALFDESDSIINDFTDVALNDRNKNWIPIIKEKMASKNTFIAFGAAHLIGDEGVIQLLRNEGYQVSPVY